MSAAPIQFHLSPGAEATWTQVVKPWLEAGRGRLHRGHVIVPTRGQAHGWKQRCLTENIPLLGVEFLAPGLARQKWRALQAGTRPVLGRELLLLGLRTLIARRLARLEPGDPRRGFWLSLQSDPERALDDFDALLKGGFRAADFPMEPLREIFGDLARWVEARGAGFAPVEAEAAGLAAPPDDAPRIPGRLLVCGLGAESWGEFFNVVAFVRRVREVTVVLPAPAFRGRADADEKWIELWQAVLGVAPTPPEGDEAGEDCGSVGALWLREPEPDAARRATVIVGRTRGDEMRLLADAIDDRLRAGAENIGVIFPRADAAHLRLAALLAARGVPFADLIDGAAMPSADTQAQRGLVAFYAGGARVDDLLALWPLLRALGAGNDERENLTLAHVRTACERSFDELHTHALAPHVEFWRKREPALAEIATLLLPAWPEELALRDALARLASVCEALGVAAPEELGALSSFADACGAETYPARVVLAALGEFLPAKVPPAEAPGKGRFERVTLTTRRRAEGLPWSHLFLVEANAGVWPERAEPSPWLPDEHRELLNRRGRFSLGVFTGEQQAALEKAGYAQLARDTRREVVFTAALFDEENPELPLSPNSWVERVLWASGEAAAAGGLEAAFAGRARHVAVAPAPAPADVAWRAIWDGRRDATRPFDEWFFCGDPASITPAAWSARRVEAGVRDPAVLWFEGVLGVARVPWEPLVRARARALGQLAHALLARAIAGERAGPARFAPLPGREIATRDLAAILAEKRAAWPADRYWDSFHGELSHVCETLLGQAFAIAEGMGANAVFATAEHGLPAEARVPCGQGDISLRGRMDLVLSDRPGWRGASVEILDFKTGGDARLNAGRMARDGKSLQLALYLAALRSAGAAGGRVWMVKIGPGESASLGMEELDLALAKMDRMARFVTTGRYGALTPERGEYPPYGYEWPLACVAIPETTLVEKFAATFGGGEGEEHG